MVKKISNNYVYTVGRRKSSVATVKLFTGNGDSTVNQMAIDKYFPGTKNRIKFQQPFKITETEGAYHFQAKVSGGGKGGQIEALVLAIARSLKKTNEILGQSLRAAGLLTVDSRVRERRMVGTGGKARRQKQSPKR